MDIHIHQMTKNNQGEKAKDWLKNNWTIRGVEATNALSLRELKSAHYFSFVPKTQNSMITIVCHPKILWISWLSDSKGNALLQSCYTEEKTYKGANQNTRNRR
jgi:hypothetical protein